MKCQQCGAATATVHVTDVVHKARRERHLCDACARAGNIFVGPPAAGPDPDPAGPQLNLQALVQLILGTPGPAAAAGLTCPACGLQYAAFRTAGRLGCPADYDAFRPALEPLLDRIHRHTLHAGKAPRAAGAHRHLAAAVAAEDYETAAALRDRLRQKERDG